MGLTRYAKDIILNKTFTEGSVFETDNLYIGLWCNSPVDSFGDPVNIGEVTAESYSRASILNEEGSFSEVFDKDVRNLEEICFEEATEDWGIITYIGIFDSGEEGNLLFWCQLETAREVVTGDIVKFPPSSIRFGFE